MAERLIVMVVMLILLLSRYKKRCVVGSLPRRVLTWCTSWLIARLMNGMLDHYPRPTKDDLRQIRSLWVGNQELRLSVLRTVPPSMIPFYVTRLILFREDGADVDWDSKHWERFVAVYGEAIMNS